MEDADKTTAYEEVCKEKIIALKDHDRLDRSPRTEMEEMREENRKLKNLLSQITKDYELLQTKLEQTSHQESAGNKRGPVEEGDELVSLSLGRSKRSASNTSFDHQEHMKKLPSAGDRPGIKDDSRNDDEEKTSLALGLDCRFDLSHKQKSTDINGSLSVNRSHENSSEEGAKEVEEEEEEATVTWPSSKALETSRGEDLHHHDQSPVKKPRVCVRARCDAPTINDGCQWRKYGQKTAKGNPCPRAYYRCTVAPSCPVRKHVQRCPDDMSILITTYEGTHNHPLPLSATAMASTTSAAASMLLSGATSSSSNSSLRGLNLYTSDYNSLRPNQFYVPNTSTSHPTITIDLASSFTIPSSLSSSSSSILSHFSSNATVRGFPGASSKSLNFGNSSDELRETFYWGGKNGFLAGYGTDNSVTQTIPYTIYNPSFGSSQKNENTSINVVHQSLVQKNNMNTGTIQQPLPAETIKAITTNPNFRSALAAALTTVIGNGGGGQERTKLDQKLKQPGEPFSSAAAKNLSDSLLGPTRNNSFGLSLASKSSPASFSSPTHQPWSMINTTPSLLHFHGSRGGSNASPGDAREQ